MDDWKDAIMDHVLGKAFTDGTLRELINDLWNHAYSLGYMEGRESWLEEHTESR